MIYTILLRRRLNKILIQNFTQKQQKLLSRLRKEGISIILYKRTKRDNNDGTKFHKIKEDDIRLALQMQKMLITINLTLLYYLVEMEIFVPLPEYLSEKGKRMEVVYFEGHTAFTLLRVCNFKASLINKKY